MHPLQLRVLAATRLLTQAICDGLKAQACLPQHRCKYAGGAQGGAYSVCGFRRLGVAGKGYIYPLACRMPGVATPARRG